MPPPDAGSKWMAPRVIDSLRYFVGLYAKYLALCRAAITHCSLPTCFDVEHRNDYQVQ